MNEKLFRDPVFVVSYALHKPLSLPFNSRIFIYAKGMTIYRSCPAKYILKKKINSFHFGHKQFNNLTTLTQSPRGFRDS